jgi:hypothetical protein
MIDYTRLLTKLSPDPGGEDVLRLRVGVVSAIAADGTVTVTISGTAVAGVPVLGDAKFAVGTVVQILSYRGSLLIIGGSAAVSSQTVIATGTSSASGTTTSTGFTSTLTGTGIAGGIHGVPFVAPASGKVYVIGRANGGNDTAAGYTILDFEIKTGGTVGSGSIVRASDENQASVYQSPTANNQSDRSTTGLVTGLTPGALYNASLTYHITGGSSSTWNRRHISVLPQ